MELGGKYKEKEPENGLAFLSTLTKLKTLIISVTGQVLQTLPLTLEGLTFRYIRLSDKDISYFPAFSNLKALSFCAHTKRLSGEGLAQLPSTLERLELPFSSLSDKDMSALSSFSNLKELWIGIDRGLDGPRINRHLPMSLTRCKICLEKYLPAQQNEIKLYFEQHRPGLMQGT